MSRNTRARIGFASALLFSLVAFACGNDGPADPGTSPSGVNGSDPGGSTSGGPGGGTTGSGATGTLAIHLTDSPFSDAKALLVSFSDVSVHRADPGEWQKLSFASGTSRTCDLKKLNGATDVLGVGSLQAGKYTQIRLQVSSAALYFDAPSSFATPCVPTPSTVMPGGVPVTIPSGEIKLNNEFTLTSLGATILLDFDGDQSVHQTGSGNGRGNGNGASGKYMMSPVIRVVSVR